MIKSTYDLSFLIKFSLFKMIELQITNNLLSINQVFANKEHKNIQKIKFVIKSQKKLIIEKSIKFNDCKIQFYLDRSIILNQKKHV